MKDIVQNVSKTQEVIKDKVQNVSKTQEVIKDKVQNVPKIQEINKGTKPFLSQKIVEKIIIEGYINILKRWPDNDGMTTYSKLLLTGELSSEQFYNILINSDEYKEKFKNVVITSNIVNTENISK